MPAVKSYPEFGSKDWRDLEDVFKKEVRDRRSNIDTNWSYYAGKMRKPLKSDGTSVDDNTILPLITTGVDKSVASMLGIDENGIIDGVEFEVPDNDIATQKLNAIFDANNKNKLLANLFTTGAIAGHNFIQIQPEKIKAADGSLLPRIYTIDPRIITVFWDAFDAERVIFYRVQFEKWRRDYVRMQDEEGSDAGFWMVFEFSRKDVNADNWVLENEIAWEHEYAPIIDFQNLPIPTMGGYYGVDEVSNLRVINDAINFTISNTQRIFKYQGHAVLMARGFKVERDEQGNMIQVRPSDIIEVPSDGDLSYVEKRADNSSMQKQLDILTRVFYNSLREVDPSTIADKIGNMTNFGIRLLYNESLIKRQSKWLSAAEALEKLCINLLDLSGITVEKVNVIPPKPLPTDILETTSALVNQVSNLEVSIDTAQKQLGYDPEEERKGRINLVRERTARGLRDEASNLADRFLNG